jgi:hypothetical protein
MEINVAKKTISKPPYRLKVLSAPMVMFRGLMFCFKTLKFCISVIIADMQGKLGEIMVEDKDEDEEDD